MKNMERIKRALEWVPIVGVLAALLFFEEEDSSIQKHTIGNSIFHALFVVLVIVLLISGFSKPVIYKFHKHEKTANIYIGKIDDIVFRVSGIDATSISTDKSNYFELIGIFNSEFSKGDSVFLASCFWGDNAVIKGKVYFIIP